MAYYMVHKRNPYFPCGTVLELFTDGFQEAVFTMVGHRMRCTGNKGIIMPEIKVKPFCMKMLRKGLDKVSLRTSKSRTYGEIEMNVDWDDPVYGCSEYTANR